jgi:acyl CoA:acetate/3-ketoacid CoA transferase alpha subunit
MSLARYVAANKAVKSGNLYEATESSLDPVAHLNAKIRILEAERDALKSELFELKLKLERVS